eukprot:Pgem_evm1s19784
MNLTTTLMLAKSQYSMANTFIPDNLLLPLQQKITTFFINTNNQFTQNNSSPIATVCKIYLVKFTGNSS